jgi:hypothetical protein
MRAKYRIYVLGTIPSDLKERIAALHASAVLAQRNGDTPGYAKQLNSKNDKRK